MNGKGFENIIMKRFDAISDIRSWLNVNLKAKTIGIFKKEKFDNKDFILEGEIVISKVLYSFEICYLLDNSRKFFITDALCKKVI